METLAGQVISREHSTATAIGGAHPMRWCDLIAQARTIARSVNSRDLVVIEGDIDTGTYVTITACVLADTPFVMRHPRLDTLQILNHVMENLEPTVSISVNSSGISVSRVHDREWRFGKRLPQLRYIGLTSGSSGPPRAVLLPVNGHDAFLRRGVESLYLTEEAVFGDPANASDLSLTNFFLSLFAGSIWIPFLQVFERVRAFQSLARYKVTHWRSVSTWVSMFQKSAGQIAINPTMQIVGFGGEILTSRTVADSRVLFPKAKILNTYGSTESNGFVSVEDVTADNKSGICKFCSIGVELDGWQFSTKDAYGSLELVITSPHIAHGYIDSPLSAKSVGVIKHLNGRLQTRDAVELQPDGKYVVVGRLDRRFNHRGVLISPEPIEKRIGSILGIDCCLIPTARDLVLLIEDSAGRSIEHDRFVLEALPSYLVPMRISRVDKLPRLPSLKIDYRAALELTFGE